MANVVQVGEGFNHKSTYWVYMYLTLCFLIHHILVPLAHRFLIWDLYVCIRFQHLVSYEKIPHCDGPGNGQKLVWNDDQVSLLSTHYHMTSRWCYDDTMMSTSWRYIGLQQSEVTGCVVHAFTVLNIITYRRHAHACVQQCRGNWTETSGTGSVDRCVWILYTCEIYWK
jgi:hypothetical protein